MDKTELLDLLKRNVDGFNRFRKENPSVNVDLAGADLEGANLARADLGRANLSGAKLRRSQLHGANLFGAVLEGADLREADLTAAMLHRTQLQGADLRGARIGGFVEEGRMCLNISSFQGVRWDREQLEEILRVINENDRWTIKYEIVPKKP